MNIGTLTATLGVDTTGLNQAGVAMKNFEKSANSSLASVAQTLDKTGRNIYYFGTASMRFLTLPLTLAGAAAFKMTKDFEYSMQKIVGLVGVSQSQVDTWSKDLLKLGPELGKGPKELADAMYFITSSGFKGANALDILTISAKASASGLGETKAVADLITSAMSAYASSGLTAAHTWDILTAAVREGKGEADDYAKTLGDVIPIASQMGVSFDQVAGAVAMVTLTGQSASKAVTGIRQALFEIEKPSVNAISVLEQMGGSFDGLRKQLQEKGLLATLKSVNDLTKKYGEESLSRVFPNIRAYNAILSVLGNRYNANILLQKGVTDSLGSGQNAYLAIGQTIEQKYNMALSSAQSSMIQFGSALKGPIISLLEGFSKTILNLTHWFTNLSASQQLTYFHFGIFLVALGPLSVAIGLLMRGVAGLSSVITILGVNLTRLYTLMLANPITATIVLLGVLATAIYTISKANNGATITQKAFNDELQRGKDLMESTVSIDEQIKVLGSLNKTQVEGLKNRIQEQLKLEDDYQATVLAKQNQYAKLRNDSTTKIVEDTRTGEKLIFKDFGTMLSDKANAELKNNQQRLQILSTYLKQVDEKLKSMPNGGGGIDLEKTRKAHKLALDEYNAYLKQMEKAGQDFIIAQKTIYNKDGRTQYTMSAKFNVPEFDTGPIDNYRLHFLKLSDIESPVERVQKKLADLALTGSVFDSGLDTTAAMLNRTASQANYLKSELQKLWDQGYRPGITLNDKSLKQSGDMYLKKLREIEALSKLEQVYSQMGNSIQNSLMQGAKSWEDFGQTVLNVARQAVTAAIAQIVADAILMAMKAAGSLGPFGLFAIPAMVGLAVGAANTAIDNIPGLAEGGIVPSGYPNDTYNARLTSGEMVVPPGKLDSVMNNSWDKEVVFKIKGYDLEAVRKKQNKKTSKV